MRLNFEFGPASPTFTHAGPAFPKYELLFDESSEEIRLDEKGHWSARGLVKPGNYTIVGVNGDVKTVLHRFSINIASEESDLTRVPVDEIEAVLGKGAVTPQDRRRSIADTLDWEEPMELFPWLMIALCSCWRSRLLANRFYRPAA